MVKILVMYWRPVIRKQQLEKEDLELQEAPTKLPAHLLTEAYYNLTMTSYSIKLIEETLLNIISKRKR